MDSETIKTSVELDPKDILTPLKNFDLSEDSGIEGNLGATSESRDESRDEEDDHTLNTSNQSTPSNVRQTLQAMKERLDLSIVSQTPPRKIILDNSYSSDYDTSFDNMPRKEDGFTHFYREFRTSAITKELKLVKTHHQDGCFVIPSVKSPQMWFGVMFIRDGPYKDGIFHFTVYFPDDFPDANIVLKFKSEVFHPQVRPKDGTLNCTNLYKKAKARNSRIHAWEIIKYARSCFYHLATVDAYNMEAAHAFKTDLTKFKSRCRSTVLDSLLEYEEQRYAPDFQSENPFRCSLVNDNVYSTIKSVLISSDDGEGGTHSLYCWAKSQLGKVLTNINVYAKNVD